MSFKAISQPVEITPGSASAWVDIDVSAYVPSGAKAALIRIENNATGGGTNDKTVGVRTNGSTQAITAKEYAPASGSSGTFSDVFVKLDANRVFEGYTESTTLIDFWLLGWLEDNADVVLFDDWIDKTPGSWAAAGTTETLSIASDTGADTATVAILAIQQADGVYYAHLMGKAGATLPAIDTLAYNQHYLIPVDASEQFTIKWTSGGTGTFNTTNNKVWLVGYIKGTTIYQAIAGNPVLEAPSAFTADVFSAHPTPRTGFLDKPSGAGEEHRIAFGINTAAGGDATRSAYRHREWSLPSTTPVAAKYGQGPLIAPLDGTRRWDHFPEDTTNSGFAIYGYLKASYTAPSGGAAITHHHFADHVQRTLTSATETEVSQYKITWATLTGAGFANGDEVIIIAKANVGGSSVTGLNGQFRASKSTSDNFAGRTTYADSAAIHEPNSTSAAWGHVWQWIRKVTLATNDTFHFSLQSASTNTARVDDFDILIIKLADLGVENWLYAETTPSGDASTTYTDGASVTIPGSTSPGCWLVLSSTHWLIDSTTADVLTKIVIGSTDHCEVRYEAENTGEEYTVGCMAISPYLRTDTAAKVQYRSDTAATHDCNRTMLFAMRLSALESFGCDVNSDSLSLTVVDTFVDTNRMGFTQRDTTARDAYHIAVARLVTTEATKRLYGHITRDGTQIPSGPAADRAGYMGNGAADQVAPWLIVKDAAEARGHYNMVARWAEDSDVTPANSITYAAMASFVLRKAATGVALVVAAAAHSHTTDSPTLTQEHALVSVDATHAHNADPITLTQVHGIAMADATHAHTAESPVLVPVIPIVSADATHGHASDAVALTQQHILALADGAHAHTTDNVELVQQHQLAAEPATHPHTADAIALTQQHAIAADAAAHAHAADAITLSQTHVLTAALADHAHSADAPTLTQQHALAAEVADHGHTTGEPTLTQEHVLSAEGATHSHVADNAVLTQAHILSAADTSHAHEADAVSIVQQHILAMADALHAHEAGGVVLGVGGDLIIGDAGHGHLADNAALVQQHLLVLADALHAHAAGAVALTQVHVVLVDAAMHAHSAESVALGVGLIVSSSEHAHTAEATLLVQQHVLALADALHAAISDQVTLTQAGELAIANALHAMIVDQAELIQQHSVIVQGALHGHAADGLDLTETASLSVAGATHAHGSEVPTLSQIHALLCNDALHAHLSDNVSLGQLQILEVSDSLFAHLAQSVTLTSGNPYSPSGERMLMVRAGGRILAIVPAGRMMSVQGDRLLRVSPKPKPPTFH